MDAGLARELSEINPGMKIAVGGIAKEIGQIIEYKRRDFPFGTLEEYSGGLPLEHRETSRSIFNIITKEKYGEKPSYGDLEIALKNLVETLRQLKIGEIAIPQLGCGKDKLKWERVEEILIRVFRSTNITLTVFYLKPQLPVLQQTKGKRKVHTEKVNVSSGKN